MALFYARAFDSFHHVIQMPLDDGKQQRMFLVGAGLGVSVAPACVKRIASPEVVCIPLRGAKVVSDIELARVVGDSRPIVEHFAQIATDARMR